MQKWLDIVQWSFWFAIYVTCLPTKLQLSFSFFTNANAFNTVSVQVLANTFASIRINWHIWVKQPFSEKYPLFCRLSMPKNITVHNVIFIGFLGGRTRYVFFPIFFIFVVCPGCWRWRIIYQYAELFCLLHTTIFLEYSWCLSSS